MRVMIFTLGFLPHTQTGKFGGQVQPRAMSWSVRLTMRSSKEWNVMTASRPPGFSPSTAARSIGGRASSSPLTAMRMAWKLRLAGCCFSRRAAGGMADLMMSTSSRVVSTGRVSRARTMARAMAGAYRSSPYSNRMRRSSSPLQVLTISYAVRGASRSIRMSSGASCM